ncbi:cytochrome c biogenesis protein DipZ [Patescibacteria group bacterium]|nr:cytochrome c biogenesis protein DipZ [Patescibacteria group bacterium]
MLILLLFALIGGIVTILSPCILPVLPIVLAGGVDKGNKRPLGIIVGFILSFTLFTLFFADLVKMTGISSDSWRNIAIVVLIFFGASLLIPKLNFFLEKVMSGFSRKATLKKSGNGFVGGLVIGSSLGLLWTPCVGPILAAIIVLAASSQVNSGTLLITLAYSSGTAIPMFFIMIAGQKLIKNNRWLLIHSGKIQQFFGILMIVTALLIYFNFDRKFQVYILDKFPSYGVGLTKIEDNQLVKSELANLKKNRDDFVNNLKNDLYPEAPEFISGGQWFNSSPLTMASLRGKVVLVDFWTYTCINCIRTLPYVENWYKKYRDKGFLVIGVHTPEFEFEKNPVNVAKAVSDFGLTYPIMQDNNYETWNAYNNQYWPADYLIDRSGRIRSTHFGEGDYDGTENEIQNLLREAGTLPKAMPIDNPSYTVDSSTPETYLGYSRMSGFSSNEPISHDDRFNYTNPKKLSLNKFSFSGYWFDSADNALPEVGSSLQYDYKAKNVFLVVGARNNQPGRIKIFLDGKFVKEITVNDYKLYDIIKLDKPGEHLLRLEFLDNNLELYAFTFG